MVREGNTGRLRAFGFVYYESLEGARNAKEQCTGVEVHNRRIRGDYSISQRAHTPTPHIYKGRSTFHTEYSTSWLNGTAYHSERNLRRSPSSYEERYRSSHHGYGRSRSRFYSPRRY